MLGSGPLIAQSLGLPPQQAAVAEPTPSCHMPTFLIAGRSYLQANREDNIAVLIPPWNVAR